MEEKKIQHYDCFFDRELSKSNLKPFDLEAAKAGKPVCTRDGRKARIICFDAGVGEYPVLALVESIENPGSESLYCYSHEGKYRKSSIGELDLVMSLEKHEGWINIYPGANGKVACSNPYKTKEEALKNSKCSNVIDTVRIEWHE